MSATEHNSPHIPGLQGEIIPGLEFNLFGYDFQISNTVFSTWIFMIILFVILILFRLAAKKDSSIIKTTGLMVVKKIYDMSYGFIGNKKVVENVLFLTGGLFVYVFLSNIYGLVLDWIAMVSGTGINTHGYLRPLNADPNTTFALSILIVLASHIVMIKTRGTFGYLKGYLFNFSGKGFEKAINVFLGWLHFISEFVKVLSLSLRLFGNIFAGIILITIIAYLGQMIRTLGVNLGEIFVLPFWFFELFVAFIQALVFFTLSSIYFQQAIEEHH